MALSLRVAPSPLLASGGGATAFAAPLTPKKRGAGLLLVSKRSRISAQLGGGDGEAKDDGKKKFITREEEPEQYWQTAGERKGENPMMTPLPYIVIFGFSTPFIILAIAFANGWIKAPLIR